MDYTNPHSCQHCEGIVLSRPEVNPDLHNASKPRQTLFLLKALRALYPNDSGLKALERTFLFEVDEEHLRRYRSDGCLFYAFILTGIKAIREKQRRGLHQRSNFFTADIEGSEEASRHVIIFKFEDDAVKICIIYVCGESLRDEKRARTSQ